MTISMLSFLLYAPYKMDKKIVSFHMEYQNLLITQLLYLHTFLRQIHTIYFTSK